MKAAIREGSGSADPAARERFDAMMDRQAARRDREAAAEDRRRARTDSA
jgi:hypothetical protein